jgi:hypothetical protein
MDSQLKSQWTTALRSEEFQQAKGVLARLAEDGRVIGHCCLGVLCEIYARQNPTEMTTMPHGSGFYKSRGYYYGEDGNYTGLPETFMEFIGLSRDQQNSLIALNDDYNQTFSEIADWIDSNIEG